MNGRCVKKLREICYALWSMVMKLPLPCRTRPASAKSFGTIQSRDVFPVDVPRRLRRKKTKFQRFLFLSVVKKSFFHVEAMSQFFSLFSPPPSSSLWSPRVIIFLKAETSKRFIFIKNLRFFFTIIYKSINHHHLVLPSTFSVSVFFFFSMMITLSYAAR